MASVSPSGDGLAQEKARIGTEGRLRDEKEAAESNILRYSDETLEQFLQSYRADLESGEPEKKKAILRSVIEHGVFDGETLTLSPNYQKITGVKMASPRGFEPLLPP